MNDATQPLSVFRYASAEQISRWCLVTKSTARDYKNGRKKPSKRALKLFHLHYHGQILGPEWRGWKVKGDRLYDENGRFMKLTDMSIHLVIYQIAAHCRTHHMHKQTHLMDLHRSKG